MSNTPNVVLGEKATRIIEEMVAVEARHIAQRQPPEAECACKDGMFPTRAPTNRRTFLFAAGSTAGAAVLATPGRAADPKAPPGAEYFEVPPDSTKQLGRPVAGDSGYGSRSQFETEVRWRFPTANEYTSWSMTPLD
jgi:sulfane dehydrogenase subunit SoxC